MLDDKSRVVLFWFTIGMVIVVVIVAVVTLLRACGGPITAESPITISPAEVSLCVGARQRFVVEGIGADDADDTRIEWKTSGGRINESSPFAADFIAGDEPGDYVITAIRSKPRYVTDATVHVNACTPTPIPSPTPPPTLTPIPSPAPIPSPTPTPSPLDARGDVGAYDSGALFEGAPASADIRAASVDADLRIDLQSASNAPEELAGWAAEGEILLWISMYAPLPDPPAYTDWLFALDLDGNAATGRSAGSARINPDLGDEAVIGALYDPASAEYAPYFLVWDPTQGGWVDGPAGVRFYIGASRTVIGLALPLETLTQAAAQTTGVTLAPDAVKGRAALLTVVGEQTVVDFCPDRPD